MNEHRPNHDGGGPGSITRRLLEEERASAMTEFVITLPIMILLFSGIGSLYRLNENALQAKAGAASDMWEEAIDVQSETYGHPVRMQPIAAAVQSGFNGGFNSFADLYQNGPSAAGIYFDSGVKVGTADLIPGLRSSGYQGQLLLKDISGYQVGSDELYSHGLLDDNTFTNALNIGNKDFGSLLGAVNSILDISGMRPAVAAGIRYGAVTGQKKISTQTPWVGSFDAGDEFDVPAPPAPTHRGLGVLMTRLELSGHHTYNESIVEFDYSLHFGHAPNGSVSGGNPGNIQQQQQQAQECKTKAEDYGQCLNGYMNSGLTKGQKKKLAKQCQPGEPLKPLLGPCPCPMPPDHCFQAGSGGNVQQKIDQSCQGQNAYCGCPNEPPYCP